MEFDYLSIRASSVFLSILLESSIENVMYCNYVGFLYVATVKCISENLNEGFQEMFNIGLSIFPCFCCMRKRCNTFCSV
jgi:hypothetical protein